MLFLMLFSCHRTVGIKNGESDEVRAVVRDMRQLDGCTFFLITADGKKLLPYDLTGIPFRLKDGQEVMLRYKRKEDVAGICMAEDMIIEVLSIRLTNDGGKPAKKECADMTDPVKTDWGRELMNKQRVNKMWKFNYQDGFAYYFQSAQKNMLYDCQGNLMCTDEPRQTKCIHNIAELTNGKIVWVLNQ